MEYESPNAVAIRRPALPLLFIVLFVISNLLLGLFGGVVGFVALANSQLPWVKSVRHVLHLDDTKGLSIPVTQNIRVEESSAVIDASKKVSPAVVSISISQQVQDFFGNVSNQVVAGGTGFILTSDGLIITNRHVVQTPGQYKVVLNDGRIFDATIKAVDSFNDFAVVKIDAKDLPTVELGDSDALQVGQYVIAIGNALGEFDNSVSLGIVSAKHRKLNASEGSSNSEQLTGLLQTDAAINPGNSGGPLVNLAGQVVGIDTAIASTNGGSVGIGFAIPINSIKNIIDSVRKTGTIVRPYLGVRYQIVNKTLQQLDNLTVDHGALIAPGQTLGEVAVLPGSPADKAGLQPNDIILEVNGEQINDNASLSDLLQKYQVGDQVTLKVLRKGATIEVKVTLDKSPTS